jgi:uncharacterized protein YkwD
MHRRKTEMKKTTMMFLSALLALGMLTSYSGRTGAQDPNANGPAQTCADGEESGFLQLVNDHRAQNGLPPLAFSQTLSVAADAHSQDMATNDFFSHTGFNGSSFVDRIAAAGYPDPGNTAENIFAGGESAAGAMESWRNSPGHNANMLSPTAQAIGIARVNNPDSTWKWYWTTTFGATVDGAACTGDGGAAVVQGAVPPAAAGDMQPADVPAEQPAGTTDTAPQPNTGQEAQPADTGANTQPAVGTDTQPAETTGTTTQPDGQPAATTDNGNATTDTNGGNGAAADTTTAGAAAAPACGDAEEVAFLGLVNQYRAENGLEPLAMSPTLTAAARDHSLDMGTQNYFDHTGLNGSTFSQRIAAAGYPGGTTAENIFAGDPTAQGAFESWRNSPGHNANMLNPAYKAIGIGRATAQGSDFGWYWTTTFGDVVDAACGGATAAQPAAGADTTDQAGATTNAQGDQTGTTGNGQGGNTATNDPNSDRDGDGLTDQDEVDFFGTNPDLFDTDGGGVGDGDEWFNFTDPLNPADDNAGAQGGGNGEEDFDGDGVSDNDELLNGTDPFDPNSF